MGILFNDASAMLNLLETFPEKVHFQLHNCQYFTSYQGLNFKTQGTLGHHLTYVRDGQVEYQLPGKNLILTSGDLIFISAHTPYTVSISTQNPSQIIAMRIAGYNNADNLITNFEGTPFVLTFSNILSEYFYHCYEIYDLFSSPDSRTRTIMINTSLQNLLIKLYFDLSGKKEPNSRIRKVRNFIIQNPNKHYTVEEYAKIAELSPKYFARLFRQETGKSVIEFCDYHRCKNAKFYLEHSSLSIKEIATMLNFPDQYSFSRQFKRVTGLSPSQLR
jgi:AraC-like DNA-binding protein